MKTFHILILEDDLSTLSSLMDRINQLEESLKDGDIAVTVLSEYMQVEEYINNTKMDFDVILLDRDCKACGSFHVLDFDKFGTDKIISISSTPKWNEEARERGVDRIILKEYSNIEKFANKAIEEIRKIII